MKKLGFVITIFLLCLVAAACSTKQEKGSTGLAGMTVLEIEEKLISGKTTKKDVEVLFGAPSGIDKNYGLKGGDRWNYYYSNQESNRDAKRFIPIVGSFIGKDEHKSEMKHLGIVFNKGGILESYEFRSQ